MASTFYDSNDLVGCGHMSGLLVRRIRPRALMKSDDEAPIKDASFALTRLVGLILVSGNDRCRSSRLIALTKVEPAISPFEWHFAAMASLCSCEHFGTEAFAGLHHCPEDAGELIGKRHSHEPCRLLRQQRDDPVTQRALTLSHYI
jgi:hypothetical protein